MRSLVLLLFAMSWPAFAATPISVQQLEQLLTTSQGKHDGQTAEGLSQLELTQRFGNARLAHWLALLPGSKSQQALIALADMSAFLNPPPADIPPKAAPGMAEQKQMIVLSVNYIKNTIDQLPNLFATRVTTSFQQVQPGTGHAQDDTRMFVAGRYKADIVYRDGGEQVTPYPTRRKKQPAGLVTSGEFGLLGTVLEDALNSSLSWSRWEQGEPGIAAVYRYSVPAEKSHYQVGSSTVQKIRKDRVVIQHFTAYAGEIAIDPSSGTILRLVMKAIQAPGDPLIKANILVEYGPLVMDSKTYVCPLRSTALSVTSQAALGGQSLFTSLNHVTFEQYHLFHADVRILNGYSVPSDEAH